MRKHLNQQRIEDMQLSMRGGPPTDMPIFPGTVTPPPGVPHLHNTDGAFDEGEADVVDDDDGLEDGSEMVIDTQPLLNNHATGLGLNPPPTGAIAPPPIAPQTPFSYVAGHPPYVPERIPLAGNQGAFGSQPLTLDGMLVDQGGNRAGMGHHLGMASTASLGGPSPLLHPSLAHAASSAEPSSGAAAGPSTSALHESRAPQATVDISSQPGQSGSPSPDVEDQTPAAGGHGRA